MIKSATAQLMTGSSPKVRPRKFTMNGRVLIFTFFLTVIASGCSDSQKQSANAEPSPSPQTGNGRAVELERDYQNRWIATSEPEEYAIREEARAAVTDFVKKNLSGWNIRGMSSEAHALKIFSIDADLEKQGNHIVITFDTRKFFPESGEPYWVAVPINAFRQGRIHALDDADLLRKLEKAQHELNDLQR